MKLVLFVVRCFVVVEKYMYMNIATPLVIRVFVH